MNTEELEGTPFKSPSLDSYLRMENYKMLEKIGEGTYGVVYKACHIETGKQVAIKKFKESYDDEYVRKTALREIRILKELKHDHVVNLIEVFRDQGKIILVFEYVDRTVLDEIENNPHGVPESEARKIIWQLLRAVAFIHDHNIIHRDIKPENLLLSRNGILKMCDFGFARPLANQDQDYTDYVSTRWYRAPELLIGDQSYGKAIDVWAIGCLFAEILTGEPLFPGDSDIQTLFFILQIFGDQLNEKHKAMIAKNPSFKHIKINEIEEDLDQKFKDISPETLDLLKKCLVMDPTDRQDCKSLLAHNYFKDFHDSIQEEIDHCLELDNNEFVVPFDRKSGTPSFNQNPRETKKSNEENYMIGSPIIQNPQKEFNVSFNNENYEPSRKSQERANLNKDDIIINTNNKQTMEEFNGFQKPNKLIHLSEVYNSKANGKSVRVLPEKESFRKAVKDPFKTPAYPKYGSPIPTKKPKHSKLSEVKPSIPVLDPSPSAFPDLNPKIGLEENLEPAKVPKKKNKKSNRVVIIHDLQHNLMQPNSQPNLLFTQNGEIIDSSSLREELKKSKQDNKESKGKLVKPKNPFDMSSVNLRSVIYHN